MVPFYNLYFSGQSIPRVYDKDMTMNMKDLKPIKELTTTKHSISAFYKKTPKTFVSITEISYMRLNRPLI